MLHCLLFSLWWSGLHLALSRPRLRGQAGRKKKLRRRKWMWGVALPEMPGATSSRFEEGMEVRLASTQMPLLLDFKELLCQQFQSPAAAHRWSASCCRFSNVHDRDQIACGPLPAVDRTLTPIISPSSSILGNTTCSSKTAGLWTICSLSYIRL